MIGVWDHPRVCGEKLRAVVFGNYSEGITPAYAGKRWRPGRGPCQFRDHPRVCGEKYSTRPYLSDEWGSPPRMRGKVLKTPNGEATERITPAYAGKSKSL